jgi:hypothetical protein
VALLRQVACEGTIDLSRFDRFDRRSWQRLGIALNYTETKNLCAIEQMQHVQILARMISSKKREERNTLWEKAGEIVSEALDMYFPWMAQATKKTRARTIESMTSLWEQKWGKLDDPATQARIQATVRMLQAGMINGASRRG